MGKADGLQHMYYILHFRNVEVEIQRAEGPFPKTQNQDLAKPGKEPKILDLNL